MANKQLDVNGHPVITMGETLNCSVTGKPFIAARDGFTFNYAWGVDGNIISDEGVRQLDTEQIRDHSKPVGAYLSGDGKHITGWKGNTLATVTQRSTSRTGWHGSRITHIRAVDQFGGLWYGKGAGNGMYITIRPMKGKAK